MFNAGPSQSGKTELALRLLKERRVLIDKPVAKIFYCSPQAENLSSKDAAMRQDLRRLHSKTEFVHGLPDWEEMEHEAGKEENGIVLCILDDLATEIIASKSAMKAFTTTSHHANISVIYITQNVHQQGKFATTITANCNYKLLIADRANKLLLSTLSRAAFPGKANFLARAIEWLEQNFENNFNQYILLDSSSLSPLPHGMHVRTRIFSQPDGSYEPILFHPK